MHEVPWVLEMSRTADAPTPAKLKALEKVAQTSAVVRKTSEDNSATEKKLRTARNKAIVAASKHATASEISIAAGIKQSYVSRVIRSEGKPQSGSALDQKRGKSDA
jgi:hypothetical protein